MTMINIDHSSPTRVEVETMPTAKPADSKLLEHLCLRLTDISDSLEQVDEKLGHLERIDDLINVLSMREDPDLEGLIKEVEALNMTTIKASEAIVLAICKLKLTLQLPSTDNKIEVTSAPVTLEVPRFLYLMTSLPFFYLVIYHLAQHYLR